MRVNSFSVWFGAIHPYSAGVCCVPSTVLGVEDKAKNGTQLLSSRGSWGLGEELEKRMR